MSELPMLGSALLERYFGYGRMERSPFGAMLDAAQLYNRGAILNAKAEQATRMKRGEEVSYVDLEFHESREITARPTAEQRLNAKDGPDDEMLAMLGSASRRLAIVRAHDPLSYQVLEAYFGDSGSKWAGRKGQTRLSALIGFTVTGQQLRRRDERRNRGAKLDLSPEERMGNLVVQAESNAVLKAMVAQARVEALGLYRFAADLWAATAEPSPAVARVMAQRTLPAFAYPVDPRGSAQATAARVLALDIRGLLAYGRQHKTPQQRGESLVEYRNRLARGALDQRKAAS